MTYWPRLRLDKPTSGNDCSGINKTVSVTERAFELLFHSNLAIGRKEGSGDWPGGVSESSSYISGRVAVNDVFGRLIA